MRGLGPEKPPNFGDLGEPIPKKSQLHMFSFLDEENMLSKTGGIIAVFFGLMQW